MKIAFSPIPKSCLSENPLELASRFEKKVFLYKTLEVITWVALAAIAASLVGASLFFAAAFPWALAGSMAAEPLIWWGNRVVHRQLPELCQQATTARGVAEEFEKQIDWAEFRKNYEFTEDTALSEAGAKQIIYYREFLTKTIKETELLSPEEQYEKYCCVIFPAGLHGAVALENLHHPEKKLSLEELGTFQLLSDRQRFYHQKPLDPSFCKEEENQGPYFTKNDGTSILFNDMVTALCDGTHSPKDLVQLRKLLFPQSNKK